MIEEDFLALEEEFKKLVEAYMSEGDGVIIIVSNPDGSISTSGTECIVCMAASIMKAHRDGIIKHRGEVK